jgi:hypothetical protein
LISSKGSGKARLQSDLVPRVALQAYLRSNYSAARGVTDGSNAPAGFVGEYVKTGPITTGVLTSGVAANITSMVLTPGDWEVYATVGPNPAGTTVIIGYVAEISTVSASFTPPEAGSGVVNDFSTYGAGLASLLALSPARVNITVSTTIYLVVEVVFITSTCTATGFMKARRIR